MLTFLGIDPTLFNSRVNEFVDLPSGQGAYNTWKNNLLDQGVTPEFIREAVYQGSLKRGNNIFGVNGWRKYYEEISGITYPGMPSHAHHLVEKASQSAAAIENRQILAEVGIDVRLYRENLTWAPNNVTGQHGGIPQGDLNDLLLPVRGDREGIIGVLRQWAEISAARG